MPKSSEVRLLLERIGILEAEIERMQAVERDLRGLLADRLPASWFHEVIDQRGVPREIEGRRLVLTERLDLLAGKKESSCTGPRTSHLPPADV